MGAVPSTVRISALSAGATLRIQVVNADATLDNADATLDIQALNAGATLDIQALNTDATVESADLSLYEVIAPVSSPDAAVSADATVHEVTATASSPHTAVPVESADPTVYEGPACASSPNAAVRADATVYEGTAPVSSPYAPLTDAGTPPPDDDAASAHATPIVGAGDDCPLCRLPMGGAPAYIGDDSVPLPASAVEAGVYRRPCGHVMHAVCAMRAIDDGSRSTACVVCKRLAAVPGDDDPRVARFLVEDELVAVRLDTRPSLQPEPCTAYLRAAEALPLAYFRVNPLYATRICAFVYYTWFHMYDSRWSRATLFAMYFIGAALQETWLDDEAPLLSATMSAQLREINRHLLKSNNYVWVYPPQGAPPGVQLAMQCDDWRLRPTFVEGFWLVPMGDCFKLVYPDGEWRTHPDFLTHPSPCGTFVNNVAYQAQL